MDNSDLGGETQAIAARRQAEFADLHQRREKGQLSAVDERRYWAIMLELFPALVVQIAAAEMNDALMSDAQRLESVRRGQRMAALMKDRLPTASSIAYARRVLISWNCRPLVRPIPTVSSRPRERRAVRRALTRGPTRSDDGPEPPHLARLRRGRR